MYYKKEVICTVEKVDFRGYGVCKEKEKKIYVLNALKGEKIHAIKIYKNYYKPKKILKISPNRNNDICPHFPNCGGCSLIHIRYEKQLEIKQKMLKELFPDENILRIIPSPKIFFYRNKMEYTIGGTINNIKIGFIERFSFDKVIDLFDCRIGPKEFNSIISLVRDYFNSKKLEPYNKRTQKGFLRFLVIRKSFTRNQIMLKLVTTDKQKVDLNKLNKLIESANIKINSLVWSINNKPSDVAIGNIKEILKEPFICEEIGKYKFRIYPDNFFQTNTYQAKNMLEFIRKHIREGGRTAVDLYSGVGLFTIGLSNLFEEIIGIEIDKDSVKTAYENKEINNVENVRFVNSPAEKIGELINEEVDYLIVDPPRSGLHRKVIRWITRFKPRHIVYVSCNPQTAKRDIYYIKKAGYNIELIQPFDQFPHTPHIETITLISRKKF